MNKKIVFGQYVNKNSWIHHLDPRTKISVLFLMMIGIFFISNLYVLLGLFAFILLLVLTSKIPLKMFLKSFRMIAMILVFTAVFQILFNRTGSILKIKDVFIEHDFTLTYINLIISIVLLILYFLSGRIIKRYRVVLLISLITIIMLLQVYCLYGNTIVTYHISVYDGGLYVALLVLLRMVNLLSLSALLTFTTKTTDLNNGIEGIFAPFKFMKKGVSIMAMMISIALRFVPTLLNESMHILTAQAARGVDFNDGNMKDKVTQIVSLLVPMFVISYKKAEDLANAMEARGYIPGEDRTRINELKYHTSDILCYIFLLFYISSIVFLKIKGII